MSTTTFAFCPPRTAHTPTTALVMAFYVHGTLENIERLFLIQPARRVMIACEAHSQCFIVFIEFRGVVVVDDVRDHITTFETDRCVRLMVAEFECFNTLGQARAHSDLVPLVKPNAAMFWVNDQGMFKRETNPYVKPTKTRMTFADVAKQPPPASFRAG